MALPRLDVLCGRCGDRLLDEGPEEDDTAVPLPSRTCAGCGATRFVPTSPAADTAPAPPVVEGAGSAELANAWRIA
jgi:hypothetical protein